MMNSEHIGRLLSPKEVATLLNISRRTFQTWRAAGRLPDPDLRIGKVIRWRAESIDAWMASLSRREDVR